MSFFQKLPRFDKYYTPSKPQMPGSSITSTPNKQSSAKVMPFELKLISDKKKPASGVMDEVYNHMISMMKSNVKTLRSDNDAKEIRLREKEVVSRQKSGQDIEPEKLEGDPVIIHKNLSVRILRTPTSRKLGPGIYAYDSSPMEKKSHNIMELLLTYNKRVTRSLSRERSYKSTSTPQTWSRKSDFEKFTLSGKSSPFKLTMPESRNTSLNMQGSSLRVQTPNKSTETANETCEVQLMQKQKQMKRDFGKNMKKFDNIKQMVLQSQSQNIGFVKDKSYSAAKLKKNPLEQQQ